MKKLIVTLAAATLLIAGCASSGSEDDGGLKAESTDASESFSREELDKQVKQQAKQQAEQLQKARDELAEAVAEKAAKAQGTVVQIEIKDGKVTPQGKRVEVKVGGKVTLEITSDADEEIHVHSDPEHSYEVSAGKTITETFTVDRPGQIAVEAHHLDVTIVQLVVRS